MCTNNWYSIPVRISTERIKSLCRERGDTLTGMLAKAGVSRNAFYSLARRNSIFPRTLNAVCARLGVRPDELLTTDSRQTEAMKSLLSEVDSIIRVHAGADRDNVRHTLLLLREKPVDRLRRALVRAKRPDIRKG